MDKPLENKQKMRERATYRYLEALDSGDINALAEVLQQAIYDAPLEQMLLDVHQAYFQQEERQAQNVMVMEEEISATATLHLPGYARKPPKHSSPRWMRTLVAILIVGVVVGSLATLLTLRQSWLNNLGGSTVTPPVCQSHPLKQYGVADGSNLGSQNSLQDVASLSVNDAWAVGSSTGSPTAPSVSESPLIEHWDGKIWQPVSSPALANGNGQLAAVAAISTNNVWAVGYRFPNTTGGSSVNSGRRTLVEHWDGKSWQIVANTDGPTGHGILNALTVVSAEDIWVAGSSEDAITGTPEPLLEHWNGSNWQVVAAGKSDQMRGGMFSDIAAIAANDIWAVGQSSQYGEIGTHSLVEHWNGSQWQLVAAPANMVLADRVSVVSTHSVWVIGQTIAPNNAASSRAAHWDGRQWKNVVLPASVAGEMLFLPRMAVVADNDIWIVANTLKNNGLNGIYVAHWDGKSWKPVKVPLLVLPTALTRSIVTGITAHNGSRLWIVGYASGGEDQAFSGFILGQLTCP